MALLPFWVTGLALNSGILLEASGMVLTSSWCCVYSVSDPRQCHLAMVRTHMRAQAVTCTGNSQHQQAQEVFTWGHLTPQEIMAGGCELPDRHPGGSCRPGNLQARYLSG